MKKKFLFYFLIISINTFSQTPGEWVWLHGDSTTNNPGNFGIQGVSSPMNEPPSLYESCEWTDLNGNFWLFGGVHIQASYADVWKYNPATNEWTWMKGPGVPNTVPVYGTQGVPSVLNNPPVAWGGINSWVDFSGNLWMYGGGNIGGYDDLWKYDINTNEWTWMKGSGLIDQFAIYGSIGIADPLNNPGVRAETAGSWVDNNGDFWLFGGHDALGDYMNDLWKYNIATNTWTWMKGSQFTYGLAEYGVMGVEDSSNTPDARWMHTRWRDSKGNFWMFGGTGPSTWLNDLWRFNPSTNNWTWMSGNNLPNIPGVNGLMCTPNSGNLPNYTIECRAAWIDVNDNLWGYFFSPYNSGLWMYCTLTNEWAMIKGDSTNQYGTWGTKGISHVANLPPTLLGSIGWTDYKGHLYMFGGEAGKWYNTLWMYTIDPCCSACDLSSPMASISLNDICPGTCMTATNNSTGYTYYEWQFPGGNPSSSNNFNPPPICYNTPGNYTVTLISSGCNVVDTLVSSIEVYPFPPPQSISQSGDTLFSVPGAIAYQWYYNGNLVPGATDYFYVASVSGDYNVIATDFHGCEVEAVINNVIASFKDIPAVKNIVIVPNPFKDKIIIYGDDKLGLIVIYNILGDKVFETVIKNQKTEIAVDVPFLENGIYFLQVESGHSVFQKKLVKM